MNQALSNTTRRCVPLLQSCALSLLVLTAGVQADDTEVFFGQVDLTDDNRPNVLFVLDTSGSMTWYGDSSTTRIDRLKDAMDEILDASENVNVGLMRFNGSYGGGSVVYPISPIDGSVCRHAYCDEDQVTAQVVETADDAEQDEATGAVLLDAFQLSMGSNGTTDQLVGLSFGDLDIPQGANIVSAKIEFTADRTEGQSTNLTISAEAADNAIPFENVNDNISDRPVVGSVAWVPEAWELNSVYETPDLKDIVQQVTDRAGWCAENTLNVIIDGDGRRDAQSQRRSTAAAPMLKVVYDGTTIPPGGGCFRKTTTAFTSQGSDDAAQFTSDSNWGRGNSYTYLSYMRIPRYQPDWHWINGFRFDGLEVPPGATIEAAYITLTSNRSAADDVDPMQLVITAQASSDAPTFTGSKWSLTNRSTVSGSVDWTLPVTASGDTVQSEDLSSLVQNVIDQPGWDTENAIALFMEKTTAAITVGSGYHEFLNHESGTGPTLTVSYRSPIDAGVTRTVKDELKLAVAGMQATGGTPISGALYEASQYLTGGAVDYGKKRGNYGNHYYNFDQSKWSSPDAQPSGNWYEYGPYENRHRYHRTSNESSWTGGTLDRDGCPANDPSASGCHTEEITGNPVYTSPMFESCQTNHVVLLSDGEPTGNGAGRRIESLIGDGCFGNDKDPAEQCGQELAAWMSETDFNSNVSGVQGIRTYTVGFDLAGNADASSFLKGISTAGGGKHFDASSTEELVKTFQDIIGAVTTVDTAFVSPGATVNQFNRLTHRDDIYFALFKPADSMRWSGNLKRYKVADQGDTIVIKDVLGNPAVDEEAGFFADEARSFWSSEQDGSEVRLGGFANELTLTRADGTPRKVYTYTGSTPVSSPVDLTTGAHELAATNTAITEQMLGITGSTGTTAEKLAYRNKLLDWARGIDVDDEDGDGTIDDIRFAIGDPMHSQPVILNYGDTPADNKTTVFVATNQGFLHALDPEVTGGADTADTDIGAAELFSWMPKELLDNIEPYYENKVTQVHTYGLDGLMSAWIDDTDKDLIIDSGEKAYLFFGMRRGGNSYYALDVSDREKPKLAWSIEGGSADFPRLGQSWSRMIPARIQKDGVLKDVVIFSGGYSTNQDPKKPDADPDSPRYGQLPSRTADTEGEGLYIVEMDTGNLVWSGLKSGGTQDYADMDFSMPGSPKVLDVDVDGSADQIWLSDTGGQVWRFDIAAFHEAGDSRPFMSGGVMAKLGSDATDAEQRRFYFEPDVSLIEYDGKRFASVSIGSGWRAHPLNKNIDDRFYVIRSPAIYEKPDGYGRYDANTDSWIPITDADLANADDLSLDIDVDGHGWYKELDTVGEKVLAPSLTVNNQVTFTTYLPEVKTAICSPAIGSGAVYILDVVSGRATADLDEDGDVDEDDEKKLLKHPGLPPPVVAIITENNEGTLIGTEQNDLDYGQSTRRTYWMDLSEQPQNSDVSALLPAADEDNNVAGNGD